MTTVTVNMLNKKSLLKTRREKNEIKKKEE